VGSGETTKGQRHREPPAFGVIPRRSVEEVSEATEESAPPTAAIVIVIIVIIIVFPFATTLETAIIDLAPVTIIGPRPFVSRPARGTAIGASDEPLELTPVEPYPTTRRADVDGYPIALAFVEDFHLTSRAVHHAVSFLKVRTFKR
jgi:hypothetical protein